jgi:hypothetical protein
MLRSSVGFAALAVTLAAGTAQASQFIGPGALSGYQALADGVGADGRHHVFVARNGTEIDKIDFDDSVPSTNCPAPANVGEARLWTTPAGVVSLGAFYAPPAHGGDGYNHVVEAEADWSVNEIYFRPNQAVSRRNVFSANGGVAAMDAFYSAANGYMHVIYADNFGYLWDAYYHSGGAPTWHYLGALPHPASDLGAYDGPDAFMHAQVLLTNGDVWEFFFDQSNSYTDLLWNVSSTFLTLGSMACPPALSICSSVDNNEFYVGGSPAGGVVNGEWYGPGGNYRNIWSPPWNGNLGPISVQPYLGHESSDYRYVLAAASDNSIQRMDLHCGTGPWNTINKVYQF